MYLVTAAQMRRFEEAANAAGLTYAEMMRRAGYAVARVVHERYPEARIVALVGPGNNGGDGLVAAARLAELGHTVSAWCWRPGLANDPLVSALHPLGVPVVAVESDVQIPRLDEALMQADVALDALLGTGTARPIEGWMAQMLDALSARQSAGSLVVVAVDLPSGLHCDTGAVDPHTVPAALTVTFGCPKIGQLTLPGAQYVGELIVEDIGIPVDEELPLTVTTAAEAAHWLPSRPLDAHKGTFGRLLVVGGSAPYTGAAYLAAAAAYRSGCGLVTVALPASLHPCLAVLVPEATFLLLAEDLGVIARPAAKLVTERWADYDAVLLGCGLTSERAVEEFVGELLGNLAGRGRRAVGFQAAERGQISTVGQPAVQLTAAPRGSAQTASAGGGPVDTVSGRCRPSRLVVDADGLNLLAKIEDGLSCLPRWTVLTPHPGEMARLLGTTVAEVNADRIATARRAAETWQHVVVLKGAYTVIAAPDGRAAVNPFAEPALARAGTGDVLAGLVGGLLAQGLDPFDAARLAAFVHGLAGQRAGEAIGRRATTAGDVLAHVPGALRQLEDLR